VANLAANSVSPDGSATADDFTGNVEAKSQINNVPSFVGSANPFGNSGTTNNQHKGTGMQVNFKTCCKS